MKNREFNSGSCSRGFLTVFPKKAKKYMESLKGPEIIRLKPEKDDSG